MGDQQPSIGRVVHYMYGDEHYAAIITAPHSRLRDEFDLDISGQTLYVMPPMDKPFSTVAVYDANCSPSSWHWPERV